MSEIIQSIGLFIATIFMFKLGVYNRKLLEKEKENSKTHALLQEKEWFQKLFKEDKNGNTVVNSNIHPDLYIYEKFNDMIKEEHAEEKTWKQRILLQNTPQGNIVMFYDLFRQAFAYFSDVHINYTTLNYCAMKYVRLFLCRDFFVDTNVLPEEYVSPFNTMKKEEEKREKEKKKKKREEKKINFDSSMFVKAKKKEEKENEKEKNDKKNENIDEKYKNNFRYMGKISNWNGLQPIPNKVKVRISDDDEYHHIQNNPNSPLLHENVNKKSYSAWKQFKKQYLT